jgi:plastocyanin
MTDGETKGAGETMRMRKATMVKVIAGLFAMAIVAAACGKSSNSASGSPSASESPQPSASASASEGDGGQITIGSDTANDHGSKDVSGASSVEVEMDDFYFDPTVITGTPGQSLTIELSNEGTVVHNFTLTDQSQDQDVPAGGTGTVTVTIPQSGFVEFFCKYHKALGMVGELSAG